MSSGRIGCQLAEPGVSWQDRASVGKIGHQLGGSDKPSPGTQNGARLLLAKLSVPNQRPLQGFGFRVQGFAGQISAFHLPHGRLVNI